MRGIAWRALVKAWPSIGNFRISRTLKLPKISLHVRGSCSVLIGGVVLSLSICYISFQVSEICKNHTFTVNTSYKIGGKVKRIFSLLYVFNRLTIG